METDLAGTMRGEFVFISSQRLARRDPSGAVFYFFSDHLGSSRIVTNSSGGVVEDSDFFPFGNERVLVDTLNNNYKFTGQERDPESGFDYFLARHYWSTAARFLQPDPMSVLDKLLANPQDLNLYSYTINNPLRYQDPNGADWTDVVAGVAEGAANFAVNTAVGVAYTAYATSPIGVVTGASQELGQSIVGGVATAASAYANEGVSGVGNQVLDQGEQGATAIVTEAALTGGATAYAAKAPIESAAGTGAKAVPTAPGTAKAATAADSVPASKGAGPPTAAERAAVNEIGNKSGCHTCGATSPGTKSGNWVVDHQPPKALGKPTALKPHCMTCSRRQGGLVANQVRKQKQTQNAGKRAGE